MSKTRKVIGVCGSHVFEQNAMKFLGALRRACTKKGYFPIVFCANSDSPEDDEEAIAERQLFDLCRYTNLCSLVILTETLKNEGLRQQIVEIGRQRQIPVFSLDGRLDGCYNLVLDYHSGFDDIVRHVLEEHGAKCVNMIAGFRGNSFSEERIAIYRKVLEEHGIPYEEERVGYGDFWDRPTKKVVKQFLESDLPMPEAIVCANDSMAIAACSVLKENGYKVPQDIIVTGFDGLQNGKYHTPMLATCDPDYEDSLKFIFQQIERAEESGKREPCDFEIKFRMIPSQSCGCQPERYYDRNGIISTLFEDVGDCSWHNLAMNQMVTSVSDKQNLMDIAPNLPEFVKMWSDHSHFACVKEELLDSSEIPGKYSRMITILRGDKQVFEEPGERFDITEFMPQYREILQSGNETGVLIVRQLNSGVNVYGYIVEGFKKLDERRLQRCNEFAMFLAHSINTVLRNYKVNELTNNLTEAYNKVSALYLLDAMTGIYNRRGFYQKLDERLQECSGEKKYLHLVSVDMDGLKYINDNFGHVEGDFAITSMAKAMVQTGGEDAICARFGGDEFVCALLTDTADEKKDEWYRMINRNVQNIPGVSGKPYPIGASVGIVCQPVSDQLDTEAMIQSADKKMYEDKIARKKQRQ